MRLSKPVSANTILNPRWAKICWIKWMKLQRFSGKQKKFKSPILLRHIVGKSMLPSFQEGGLLVAFTWFTGLKPRDVVIIRHEGREKVKRVHKVRGGKLFVLGDNSEFST